MLIQVIMLCCGMGMGSKLHRNIKEKYKKKSEPQESPKNQNDNMVQKFSPEKTNIDYKEKEIDRNLGISLGSVGMASAGALFFHPLSILSSAGVIFTCIPLFHDAKDAVFKERRVRIEILDSVAVLAGLACGLYFASALSVFVYYGAKKIRLITINKSNRNLVSVFEDQPVFVWVLKDGVEVQTPFELLQAGDTIVVNAGESVPADGIITQGLAMIEQNMLTGESQPVEKEAGDRVFAATIVISGRLYIEVEKAGQETVASKIAEILNNTSDFTSSVESAGQEVADKSVIPTFALSALAYPVVGMAGATALLFSDFLDNMRVVAPLSMLNFLRIASRTGILIKDGHSLQLLPEIDTVVFDKTGTLTMEQPHVRNIYTFNGMEEDRMLTCAAAAEYRQSHPVAMAIIEEAQKRGLNIPSIDKADYKIGYGITVNIANQLVRVGSDRFMEMEGIIIPAVFNDTGKNVLEQGSSLVYVAVDNRLGGAIELETTIRPEAEEIIQKLKQRNISLCILSGDHEKPTQVMAEKLGIDSYFAEVLPENKADLIEKLQEQGKKVCFIGDGINDSIALKKANVSISMSGASTAATDSAQIVMMDKSLKKLPELFDIAYQFQNNMNDIFYTICGPAVLGIGGVFFGNLGIPAMLLLYSVSMFSGSATAMIPYFKEKEIFKNSLHNNKIKKLQ